MPLLLLRDDSLGLASFSEDMLWRMDLRKWLGLPGVFQVFPASSEKLIAIMVVEESETRMALTYR